MKKFICHFLLSTLLFLIPYASIFADVKLPGILTSNMVFQRDHDIRIWGWAPKGENVTLTFNKIVKKSKADASGKWKVIFPPMQAGGPYELKVQGKNTIILDNILIGDVWICSGQSNMAMMVKSCNDPQNEIANANYPRIRLMNYPRNFQKEPVENVENVKWTECSPETAGDFSAVAYFFGRHIHKELNVPIGLINTSWGGTNAEAWTSMDYLVKIDKYRDFPAVLAENLKKTDSLTMARYKTPNVYHSSLYNGMIHPLLNLAVRGAIWYQGESNAYEGKLYQKLFPNMIECWRSKWGQPEMPFLFVQLANYTEELAEPSASNWANLREAQLMTLSLPNTGMAVIIDIGDARDIHPKNKQDVGYRLALNALRIVYDRQIIYSGPIYRSMEVEGNRITLSFNHTGSGLMAKDRYGYLKSFAIAGEDRKFYWARAEIKGDQVIVYSDQVTKPVAVRYAWADNPADANLYNKEGLPASPFRTDSW
jgi:sialate O-acetylesterase